MLNIEFKASTNKLSALEALLLELQPRFIGEDHQIDTYFNVSRGRLKLREGNIEHALIQYDRENSSASKSSEYVLYQCQPGSSLKDALTRSLGIKAVVDKHRKIYFIDNVKFHFDNVVGLGQFVEVEATDMNGTIAAEKLQAQCNHFAALFNIAAEDLIAVSYSDMVLEKNTGSQN